MKKVILTLILSFVICHLSSAQIGTWKNHLAYHDIQQIKEAGNYLFVLASNDLYQYNKNDQSIVTYDKVNGLSDTYITNIKWCQQAKRLIAVYQNCNIDLVETSGDITNISAIYTKVITGDKSINSIYIYNEYAYLACGFGIVKMNVKKAEISESYMLGFPVTAVTISGNTIYAKTSQGILSGQLSDNLIDKANWKTATSAPSFEEDNSDYENNIDLVKTLEPGGPESNKCMFLNYVNNKLYTCGGTFSGNFSPGIEGNIQVWDGNEWTIFQNKLESITGHSYVDLATLDVDPLDPTHVFAGGRIGLYEFKNGKFIKEYNYHNSELKTTAAIDKESKNYTMVQAVKYDEKGSLWLFNSGSPTHSLFEITTDGTWIDHHKKEFMNSSSRALDNMVNAMFDSRKILWCCNQRFIEPAVLCYQPSNDVAIAYKRFINQDGTEVKLVDNGINCVAEDIEGNIWIGTTAGPIVLMKEDIGKSNDEITFTQVKVPRNDGTNYADYLLAGIEITSIAIDGGGRKWFGTNGNGVYLISADNMQEVQHFTTENSPLISNIVPGIAINHTTGEVFFGTSEGLCSYISDATSSNSEMSKDNVWAYPNPVQPDYTGYITITGLTYDADIKIVSPNGTLVNKGRSNGGTYIWDGNNLNGDRVASGIYMVMTATSTGNKGTVCKIAIIN